VALVYPLGLAAGDFSDGTTSAGYQPQNFVYGAHFSLSAGTVTQLGVKCVANSGGSVALKIGIYTSGGVLLAQSTAATGASGSGLAWQNSGAISASVSAGTHYVLVSAATDQAVYGYDTSGAGTFATEAYATAMAATETITAEGDAGQIYGVRLDFTAGGGAASLPPRRAFPQPILMH
jgi:hypothetical protein